MNNGTHASEVLTPDGLRENLNAIIAESEAMRGVSMPRIGTGHSEYPGGIFSLLHDPGGIVHTPRSGAQVSGFVDVDNDDPTANWSKTLLLRLGIPKAAVTPWNAFGAYGERPGVRAIRDNVPLCQELLDKASPIAVIAQGRWAQKMVKHLRVAGTLFCVPHPSRRGRASYRGASGDIECAFRSAYGLLRRK